jgi:hypothetical protein
MIEGVVNLKPRRKRLGYGKEPARTKNRQGQRTGKDKEPARTSIRWVAVYSLSKGDDRWLDTFC